MVLLIISRKARKEKMRIMKIENFSLTRNGEKARIDFVIDGNKISADLLDDGDIKTDGTDDASLIEGIWNGATLFFDSSITGKTVYEVEANIANEWLKAGNFDMFAKQCSCLGEYTVCDAGLIYGKDFFLVW
jgi:hypothetical protein